MHHNKKGTSQVGSILEAQKAQSFQIMPRSKNSQKIFETPEGRFRARKTLQKFRYSVLGHMGALVSNHCLLSTTQFTSVITSKIQIVLKIYRWIYIEKANFRPKTRILKQSHCAKKRNKGDHFKRGSFIIQMLAENNQRETL